jgi:type II secretory pathway pseudopilin PulG
MSIRARGSYATFAGVRGAFSLVELTVVLAIVIVLLAMSIPAVQNMREVSRRSNCQQNLAQLALALTNYSVQFEHYPAGTVNQQGPIKSEPQGYHHNWVSSLLPYLNAEELFQTIDFDFGVYATQNQQVASIRMPRLLCPSADVMIENSCCYAGLHASTETPIDQGNDGVFLLNRGLREDEIPDGLGYTLFLGEKLSRPEEDLGWMSGTRSTLRNTGHAINAERARIHSTLEDLPRLPPLYVGGLASDHPGGAFLLLGSGEIEFRSPEMDPLVLQQMASRHDAVATKDASSELAASQADPKFDRSENHDRQRSKQAEDISRSDGNNPD